MIRFLDLSLGVPLKNSAPFLPDLFGSLEGQSQLPGEILFALPVPLKVIRASNLRKGPGLNFKVIATLKAQTPLVGYSYKGQWVRVRKSDGRAGWVFQTLVGGR